MKKRVLSLMLAVLMLASLLAGCGGGENAGTDSNAIRIGTSGPLTGENAMYGNAVANGLKLAFEEINAKGGLQFELNAQDDEADTEKAVNAYNTLLDWGMQIMAGPTTSGASAATAANCAADRVFMLTPSASDPAVIQAGDNVFQICFSDPNQGIGSADYIAAHKLGTAIGVIYDASNAYSAGVYEKFRARAAELNLDIVAVEAFTNDNKADLTTQVTKCQAAGCDLVFMPIYAQEATQVLTYADKIGYKPLFFGCDGLDGILAVKGFDPALAEGVVLLTPFDATASDEKTRSFVSNYVAKYGETPNQFAADAYDVAYAIAQACETGKVAPGMSAEEVCRIMMEQLLSMTFDGITGENMTWSADGSVSKMPKAVKIENGVYVGLE